MTGNTVSGWVRRDFLVIVVRSRIRRWHEGKYIWLDPKFLSSGMTARSLTD